MQKKNITTEYQKDKQGELEFCYYIDHNNFTSLIQIIYQAIFPHLTNRVPATRNAVFLNKNLIERKSPEMYHSNPGLIGNQIDFMKGGEIIRF